MFFFVYNTKFTKRDLIPGAIVLTVSIPAWILRMDIYVWLILRISMYRYIRESVYFNVQLPIDSLDIHIRRIHERITFFYLLHG